MKHTVENPILRRGNETFFADICVEYEEWCIINCTEVFEVINVAKVTFENYDDAMNFVSYFWKVEIK